MPASFPLRIVTPERTLYTGEAESLRAPGSEGSFGVLARHAPMVASLATGRMEFLEAGDRRQLATSGGFVEISVAGVTVLAETAEFGSEIDVARAEAARERARERLAHRGGIDATRAEASLQRAVNRLRVASAGA